MFEEKYEGAERRLAGWTLWREVYGTFLGMLPFIIALIVFGATLYADVNGLKIEQKHMKEQQEADRTNARYDRDETSRKLDRISQQIETLQQQVARDGAERIRSGR